MSLLHTYSSADDMLLLDAEFDHFNEADDELPPVAGGEDEDDEL